MLKIINDLAPFFEDCYERISVRKYSRIVGISPPTASRLLKDYEKEGLLERSSYERYMFFSAKRDSKDFVDISRIYWRKRLSVLTSLVSKRYAIEATVVLFGSLSKAETKKTSDIDLALIGVENGSARIKPAELSLFQKELDRKIELFEFKSLSDVMKLPIWKAVLNGYILMNAL
jgi:predicted nucleotidyltransferase